MAKSINALENTYVTSIELLEIRPGWDIDIGFGQRKMDDGIIEYKITVLPVGVNDPSQEQANQILKKIAEALNMV